jgi:hypothetical protein
MAGTARTLVLALATLFARLSSGISLPTLARTRLVPDSEFVTVTRKSVFPPFASVAPVKPRTFPLRVAGAGVPYLKVAVAGNTTDRTTGPDLSWHLLITVMV